MGDTAVGLSQEERMRQVVDLLDDRESVSVAELSKLFDVSAVTVRADLSQMSRRGLIVRVRGGARAPQRENSEVAFDLRLRMEAERKRAIARAAAELVYEGEAIALDSSTTAYYLALELRTKREIVVVTNGLRAAAALADAPGVTVLVTGGILRTAAMSLVGDTSIDVLRTTSINRGFLGARGISLERGLMDLNPEEVRIKSEMANACQQVYGLLDSTKWSRSALLSVVPAEKVQGIFTDSDAPTADVEAWRRRGTEVVAVEAGGSSAATVRSPLEQRQPGGTAENRLV